MALWSQYAGADPFVKFVRVGTLDQPDRVPPDIHIFTASKPSWVVTPSATRAVSEYCNRDEQWPAESIARGNAVRARFKAQLAAHGGRTA